MSLGGEDLDVKKNPERRKKLLGPSLATRAMMGGGLRKGGGTRKTRL